MRLSPVQLLASRVERIRIDSVSEQVAPPPDGSELSDYLLLYRHCTSAPDYWDGEDEVEDGLKERTYLVRLGLKTAETNEPVFPYRFEVVVSGFFAVFPESVNDTPARDIGVQYGLTILLGTIREVLMSNTARMVNGPLTLPTFTFLGETFAAASSSEAVSIDSPKDG